MSATPPLPMRLQKATFDSTCPDCEADITEGDLIGQFGRYESYLCHDCSQNRLFEYLEPDLITEAILDVREEARLRHLLDLDMGRIAIVVADTGSKPVTWVEDPDPDIDMLASIRVEDELLLVTRPVRLDPYAVSDETD